MLSHTNGKVVFREGPGRDAPRDVRHRGRVGVRHASLGRQDSVGSSSEIFHGPNKLT